MAIETPVVLLIFKRPDTTKQVLQAIRQIKPSKLFVVADGPRPHSPNEAKKCQDARLIIDQVDWDCEVRTNFSEKNLGSKMRVFTGLNWVFSNVKRAIILEDDCLPNPSFFPFCDELLEYYEDNPQIMAINGQNIQFGRCRSKYSYYFSRYFHSWGWASWRRAWENFDIEMKEWPSFRNNNSLYKIFSSPREIAYWERHFEETYRNKIDSWDYPWLFNLWLKNGLVVTPEVNLISNIGFHPRSASNTAIDKSKSLYAEMQTQAMEFPIQHPPVIACNQAADQFSQLTHYNPKLLMKARMKLSRMVGSKGI